MCKLATEISGIGSMAADLGRDVNVVLYADSSAAIAIAKRRGAGKLSHINIGLLWIQDKTESKEVAIKKVKGISNPADMMTKVVNQEKLQKYMSMTKQKLAEGRAKESLKVKKWEDKLSWSEKGKRDTERKDIQHACKKGRLQAVQLLVEGGVEEEEEAEVPSGSVNINLGAFDELPVTYTTDNLGW